VLGSVLWTIHVASNCYIYISVGGSDVIYRVTKVDKEVDLFYNDQVTDQVLY